MSRPVFVVGGQRAVRREHREHPGGHGLARRIVGWAHPMDHPLVALGLEEHVAPLHASPVEVDDPLVGFELLEVVRSRVPDGHRSRAVGPARDLPVEVDVLERVILRVHREMVGLGQLWDAAWDRPRQQHPVVLEAQVPVQATGVVLVHHESALRGGASPAAAGSTRLRCPVEVTLRAVRPEVGLRRVVALRPRRHVVTLPTPMSVPRGRPRGPVPGRVDSSLGSFVKYFVRCCDADGWWRGAGREGDAVDAHCASSDTMNLRLWAHPRELAPLRSTLREWVMQNGGSRVEADEVSLAVSEAATNTIEHAYHHEEREIVVTGSQDDGVLELRVRDFGDWREPRQRAGRGLDLARALMDSVDVDSTPEGTEVRIRRRLGAGFERRSGSAAGT